MGGISRLTKCWLGVGTLIYVVLSAAFALSISYDWWLAQRNIGDLMRGFRSGVFAELDVKDEEVLVIASSPLECDYKICEFQGICGPLSKDDGANGIPRVTMLAMPKPISRNSLSGKLSSRSVQQLIVFRAWVHFENVQVMVLTQHCQTLKAARQIGLTTLSVSSGSEVRDLTYRNAFSLIEGVAKTSLVGICNSDIFFTNSLTDTLLGILKASKVQNVWKRFMITGKRRNYDVPQVYDVLYDAANMTTVGLRASLDTAWFIVRDRLYAERGNLFIVPSQDYWVWRRPLGLAWFRDIPPYLVGGFHFGNWFTSYVNSRGGLRVIDTTSTVVAFHLNHAKGRVFAAHHSDVDNLNGLVRKTTDQRAVRLQYYSTLDPITNKFLLVNRNSSDVT